MSTSLKNHRLLAKDKSPALQKAQASMELLAFFSMALLIFSIAYMFVFEKTQNAYDLKARADALDIGNHVSSEIDTALAEGDGYSKTISLPSNILGVLYTVSVDRNYVFVSWRGKNAASRTTADSVIGNFIFGNNKISNRGGVIFVN